MLALVTGGSYGIGSTIVDILLEDDWKVVSISRSEPPHHKMGVKNFIWVKMDLMETDEIPLILADYRSYLFDLIVLNAAMQERRMTQWDLHQWKLHMELNCFAHAELIQQLERLGCLKQLKNVLLLGSHASTGSSRAPAYAMSKAAIWTFLMSKLSEWERVKQTPIDWTDDVALQQIQAMEFVPCVNQLWPGRVVTPGNPADDPAKRTPADLTDTLRFLLTVVPPNGITKQTIDLGA